MPKRTQGENQLYNTGISVLQCMQGQYDDSFGCCSYICKVLVSVLFFSRNAAVVPASLGFKSLTPPTTHAQFDNKAYHAETKFEKGASDRNL